MRLPESRFTEEQVRAAVSNATVGGYIYDAWPEEFSIELLDIVDGGGDPERALRVGLRTAAGKTVGEIVDARRGVAAELPGSALP